MPSDLSRPNRGLIPVASPTLDGNERKYLLQCLDSTRISSSGAFLDRLENEFASFCKTKHAVACSNGTAALHLAMAALGVDSNSEVLVPSLTFIASANAIKYCGGKPVFVDSEPHSWNLDACRLEGLITPRTKGIVVVHLYGHPADMDPILDVARRYKLFVVEDAAEAHGALYKGRPVGSLGDCATFSFFGNKIITSGEGGAVVTSSDELARKMRILRGQGMDPDKRYWFPVVGFNYRMTNLQAAIAVAQLERSDNLLSRRREIARQYQSHLNRYSELLELPREASWAQSAVWMYSVLLSRGGEEERDRVMGALAEDGIETRPLFYPLHTMPPYASDGQSHLPVAESLACRGITLPTHCALTAEDITYVCERLVYHVSALSAKPQECVRPISSQPVASPW
jgi:perosamine synthetase